MNIGLFSFLRKIVMNLREIFEECVAEKGQVEGVQKFLIKAKKENPLVKMGECMEIAGFTSNDEKESVNLGQKFRTQILNPLRDYLTKKLCNLTDSEVERLWGRQEGEKTAEQRAQQETVLRVLPARSRNTQARVKDMGFVDELLT
jgi:hypothetical protein